MKTNGYKLNDIISIKPFGESPVHFCRIKYFKNNGGICFAMGDWYSKNGNKISDTGFDVNYIQNSNPKDFSEAVYSYLLKN